MRFVHYLEYDDIDQNGEKNNHAKHNFPSNSEKILKRSGFPSQDSYVKLPYQAFQENSYMQLQENSPVRNP